MVPGLLVIVGQHVSPRHAKTCAMLPSLVCEVKALRKLLLTASCSYLLRSAVLSPKISS